jgi:hypothetical protein
MSDNQTDRASQIQPTDEQIIRCEDGGTLRRRRASPIEMTRVLLALAQDYVEDELVNGLDAYRAGTRRTSAEISTQVLGVSQQLRRIKSGAIVSRLHTQFFPATLSRAELERRLNELIHATEYVLSWEGGCEGTALDDVVTFLAELKNRFHAGARAVRDFVVMWDAALNQHEHEATAPPPALEQTSADVTGPPPALLSAADLASLTGQSVDKVDSFLRRYRENYPDCYVQNESKRKTDPKYLYRTADVLPALQARAKSPLMTEK